MDDIDVLQFLIDHPDMDISIMKDPADLGNRFIKIRVTAKDRTYVRLIDISDARKLNPALHDHIISAHIQDVLNAFEEDKDDRR